MTHSITFKLRTAHRGIRRFTLEFNDLEQLYEKYIEKLRKYNVNQRRVHYLDNSRELIKLDSAGELQEAIKALNGTSQTIELVEAEKQIVESNKNTRRMVNIKKMRVESKISKQKPLPKHECMNTEAETKENDPNSANVNSAEDLNNMEIEYELFGLKDKPSTSTN